jgi:hypothetical protein
MDVILGTDDAVAAKDRLYRALDKALVHALKQRLLVLNTDFRQVLIDTFLDPVVCRHFMLLKKRYASGFSARKGGRCRSSIVFHFRGESLSLQYPEDFFLCLLVGHPFPHKGKHQLIHERIQCGEFPCVHS